MGDKKRILENIRNYSNNKDYINDKNGIWLNRTNIL